MARRSKQAFDDLVEDMGHQAPVLDRSDDYDYNYGKLDTPAQVVKAEVPEAMRGVGSAAGRAAGEIGGLAVIHLATHHAAALGVGTVGASALGTAYVITKYVIPVLGVTVGAVAFGNAASLAGILIFTILRRSK